MKLFHRIEYWTRHINMMPKLLINFLLVSLLPLGFGAYYFHENSTKVLEEEIGNYTVEIAQQVDSRLSSFIQELERVANIFRYNEDVQQFLRINEITGDSKNAVHMLKTRELIVNVAVMRNYMAGIFVVNDAGVVVYDGLRDYNGYITFDFHSIDWHQALKTNGGNAFLPVHPQTYAGGSPVVSYVSRLTDFSTYADRGTILIDFDPAQLQEMSDNIQLGRTGYVFMLTSEGQPVNPNDRYPQGLVAQPGFQVELLRERGHFITNNNGVPTLIGFYTSPRTGWKIVGTVPFAEVASGIERIRMQLFFIILASLVFIIVIAFYFSRAITNPLRSLEGSMKKVEQGDFESRIEVDRRDELGRLGHKFNHMLEMLEQLKREVYETKIEHYQSELLRKESEMRALQAQINPHFLYNTLNTMTCIAEINDMDQVSNMSRSLAQMFRYSISGDRFSTLGEEIAHAEAYLGIISIRHDTIHTIVELPDDLRGCKMLKLIIQPLVENAVIHAFVATEGIGTIRVTVLRQDDRLLFTVADDGQGIQTERLAMLKGLLNANDQEQSSSSVTDRIGLSNVAHRLRMHYGEAACMEMYSVQGQGTKVTVTIPLVIE